MKLTTLLLLLFISSHLQASELVKVVTQIPSPMGKTWTKERTFCLDDQAQKQAHKDPIGTFMKHLRDGYQNPDNNSMVKQCKEQKAQWNKTQGQMVLLCQGNSERGMKIPEIMIDMTAIKTKKGMDVTTKMNPPGSTTTMMQMSSEYILTGENCQP